jgi:S1-C subfamily serine protease
MSTAAANETGPVDDGAALDAYSETVIRVARTVTPHVAAIEMTGNRRNGRFRVGAGSAVLFTEDGYLLTNAHVVAGTQKGRAVFADGSGTDLEVVGADPLSDLAVVRGRAPHVAPAEFGDAESLQVGQLVIAVGNPLGLSGSVTAGVVSGLGRAIPVWAGRNRRVIEDVIQTDAALNAGSSGGALADSRSRIVGINTAVAGAGWGWRFPSTARRAGSSPRSCRTAGSGAHILEWSAPRSAWVPAKWSAPASGRGCEWWRSCPVPRRSRQVCGPAMCCCG